MTHRQLGSRNYGQERLDSDADGSTAIVGDADALLTPGIGQKGSRSVSSARVLASERLK